MTKRQHPDATPDDSDDGEDTIMHNPTLDLAIRTREPQINESASLHLSALESNKTAFLVTINPPAKPAHAINHVSCDIVIVIDVSGSMADLAPLPDVEDETEKESSNLTVLDLVKHSCRTIIETLNEKDRLSLVTFSYHAEVITPLLHMTEEAKKDTIEKITKLQSDGATNLWDGIKTGLQQFEGTPSSDNVQGLYVLTDGQPNYMCPQQGYIPKLQPILTQLASSNGSAPSIQTFGFGYSIRSDLMLSIAKAGNGNYAFIPEVSMIGTVFVHAVANLYSTYATNAVLDLTMTKSRDAMFEHRSGLPVKIKGSGGCTIKLGNLMYGQSRDLVIHISNEPLLAKARISANLKYFQGTKSTNTVTTNVVFDLLPALEPSVSEYHLARDSLCKFLADIYPLDNTRSQHNTASERDVRASKNTLLSFVNQLHAIPNSTTDPNLSSLLSDLIGPQLDPSNPSQGQVFQALDTTPQKKGSLEFKSYWGKWGRHFLSSLWCAHMRQTCNSFKDAGPLRYGANSELFNRCRTELDTAFDNLPPPEGTWIGESISTTRAYNTNTSQQNPRISQAHMTSSRGSTLSPMARFNNSSNVCFLGSCTVQMSDGRTIKVQDLRSGMAILNSVTNTSREIAAVVKSTGNTIEIVRVGELWITPWHPITTSQGREWIFPHTVAEQTRYLEDGEAVYSILLTPSDIVDDHVIEVGGVGCVTLGHGLVEASGEDVRAHAFFGDYRRVEKCLRGLSVDEVGRYLCGGLIRDVDGLGCGVLGASASVDGCIGEGKGGDGCVGTCRVAKL